MGEAWVRKKMVLAQSEAPATHLLIWPLSLVLVFMVCFHGGCQQVKIAGALVLSDSGIPLALSSGSGGVNRPRKSQAGLLFVPALHIAMCSRTPAKLCPGKESVKACPTSAAVPDIAGRALGVYGLSLRVQHSHRATTTNCEAWLCSAYLCKLADLAGQPQVRGSPCRKHHPRQCCSQSSNESKLSLRLVILLYMLTGPLE